MAELAAEIVDQVVETCKEGADEAAEALARALDADGLKLAVGEPGTPDSQGLSDQYTGPGLVIVLTAGSSAALLVLPENTQLVPSWCADPDVTGKSKLTTLSQELGMILLPEEFTPDEFKAVWLDDLADVLSRAEVAAKAASVPLELSQADKRGVAHLVWPAVNPGGIVGPAAVDPGTVDPGADEADSGSTVPPQESTPQAESVSQSNQSNQATGRASLPWQRQPTIDDLPGYSRSLLRIKIPVVVTLAQKRQKLGEIVELGPGSIIQFDKSCEEMLELDVGQHRIAVGEAVKVGDKFGLRVASLILPNERFKTVRPTAANKR